MRGSASMVALLLGFGCEASGGKAEPKPKVIDESSADQPGTSTATHVVASVRERAFALADKVDASGYEADLRFIAAIRPPGSDHWRAVQDRCAETFERAGFEVSRVTAYRAGTSVVGRKLGRDPELPAIVVGAHYDHIEGCAGADDNASGTAAVLSIARVFGAEAWDRTLYVACWDEEENGLLGSTHWVDQAVAAGTELELYVNFDAIGYTDDRPHSQKLPPGAELAFAKQLVALEGRQYRADFIAMLADDGAHDCCQRYQIHADRLGLLTAQLEIPGALKNSPMAAELRRSDHASFWKHDIPALFLSDTAPYRTDTYHCLGRPDTVETLDLEFALAVTRAAVGTLTELLAAHPGE